jgi:TolA-binding protein
MFNEILKKHTKPCTCREIYNISSDLEITIDQKENKVVMWGFNHKSDRFLNLSTKRFQKLMDGFKSVASDLYSSGNYYYITIDTSKKESRADKSYEVEIEELNKKIDCLNDIIARLEARNNRLEQEVNKYKDFKRNLDDLKKGVLIHNARGAGRKAKFTDKQIEEIRRLREDGNTIKEIANRYNCSVGLIHKLINEN